MPRPIQIQALLEETIAELFEAALPRLQQEIVRLDLLNGAPDDLLGVWLRQNRGAGREEDGVGRSKDEPPCSWFDELTTSDVQATSNSPHYFLIE